MVSRPLVVLAGWLCAAQLAQAELELTPIPSTYELDGASFRQLTFLDGGKRITYAPPQNWSYSGSGNRLVLRPPNKSLAEASVSRLPLTAPDNFGEDRLKKLVEEVLASLPAGSVNVQLVSQEKNPVQIDRKETFLVMVTYIFAGEAYARSVLFLNRPLDQMRFSLTSRKVDFDTLQKQFLASQCSWQNL